MSEAEKVSAVVMGLADVAGDKEAFQDTFVSGNAPTSGEEYATCMFEVTGVPVVSGDEATAKVKLTTGMADSSQGDSASTESAKQETREVTWTLAKSGGEWKIKDAPLN